MTCLEEETIKGSAVEKFPFIFSETPCGPAEIAIGNRCRNWEGHIFVVAAATAAEHILWLSDASTLNETTQHHTTGAVKLIR